MSKLTESLDNMTIGALGHIYIAPVGTPQPNLDNYKFDGEDLGAWKWIGDTSSDNLPEFEADDDKDSAKRTWDRKNARSGAKVTGTITSVAPSKALYEMLTAGGIREDDGYVTTSTTTTTQWAIIIVVEDGATLTGLLIYAGEMSISGLPKWDLENYNSVAIKVTAERDGQGRLYKTLYPRPRAGARTVAAAGVSPVAGGGA